MRVRRTVRTVAVAATLVLTLSGCYEVMAANAKKVGGPVPWFCNPVAPNSVTGPGMGTVDFYAGQQRRPLDDACIQVGAACHDQWNGGAARSAAPTGFCAIGQLEGVIPEG